MVPFEAAAFGTPTAFVKFGPFRETRKDVEAPAGWRIDEFADGVERLRADPAAQLAGITAVAATRTWQRCAYATLAACAAALRRPAARRGGVSP